MHHHDTSPDAHEPSQNPPRAAQRTPAEAPDQPLSPLAERGIDTYGDAFRAFLSLPDIDPARDDLLDTFHECYVDTYTSRTDAIEHLIELDDWISKLSALADDLGVPGGVRLNEAALWQEVTSAFDVIADGTSFHIFTK